MAKSFTLSSLTPKEEIDQEQEKIANRFYALAMGNFFDILHSELKSEWSKIINVNKPTEITKFIDEKITRNAKLRKRLVNSTSNALADLWRNAWSLGKRHCTTEIYTNYKTNKDIIQSFNSKWFSTSVLAEFAERESNTNKRLSKQDIEKLLKTNESIQSKLLNQLIREKSGYLTPAAFDIRGKGANDPFAAPYYDTIRLQDIQEKVRTASQGMFADSNKFATQYLQKRNIEIAQRYTTDYQQLIKSNIKTYLQNYNNKGREAELFEVLVGNKEIAALNRQLTEAQKSAGNEDLRFNFTSTNPRERREARDRLDQLIEQNSRDRLNPPISSGRYKRLQQAIQEGNTQYIDRISQQIDNAAESIDGVPSLQKKQLELLQNPNNKKLQTEVEELRNKFTNSRRLTPILLDADAKAERGENVDLNTSAANRNALDKATYNQLVKLGVIDKNKYGQDYEFSPWQIRKLKEELKKPSALQKQKFGLTEEAADKAVTESLYTRVEKIAYTEIGLAYNMGRLEAMMDNGVEYVQWISVLDSLTSTFCQSRNGAIKPLAEVMNSVGLRPEGSFVSNKFPNTRKPATNADGWMIPAHPYCRSYWQPVIGKNKEELKQMMAGGAKRDAEERSVKLGTVVLALTNIARITALAQRMLKADKQAASIAAKNVKKRNEFIEGFLLGSAAVLTPAAAYYFFSRSKLGEALIDIAKNEDGQVNEETMNNIVSEAMNDIQKKLGQQDNPIPLKQLESLAEEEFAQLANTPIAEDLKMVVGQINENSKRVLNILDQNSPELINEPLSSIIERMLGQRSVFLESGRQLAAQQRKRIQDLIQESNRLQGIYRAQGSTALQDLLKDRLYDVDPSTGADIARGGLMLNKAKKLVTNNNRSINDFTSDVEAKINTAERLIQENPALESELRPEIDRLKLERNRINNFLNRTAGYNTPKNNQIGSQIQKANDAARTLGNDLENLRTDIDIFRGESNRLLRTIEDSFDETSIAFEPTATYSGQFFQNLYDDLLEQINEVNKYTGINPSTLDQIGLTKRKQDEIRSAFNQVIRQGKLLERKGITSFDTDDLINSEFANINNAAIDKINRLNAKMNEVVSAANERGYAINVRTTD